MCKLSFADVTYSADVNICTVLAHEQFHHQPVFGQMKFGAPTRCQEVSAR